MGGCIDLNTIDFVSTVVFGSKTLWFLAVWFLIFAGL